MNYLNRLPLICEWSSRLKLKEITKENIAMFGANNLRFLLADIKSIRDNEENSESREIYKNILIDIYTAYLDAKELPLFSNLRKSGHFSNGDKVFIYKNARLNLCIVQGCEPNTGNITLFPKEGDFTIPERYSRYDKSSLIRIDELGQFHFNNEYATIWAKINHLSCDNFAKLINETYEQNLSRFR